MKKFATIASMAALATVYAGGAHAAYEPQGMFGGRSNPDGAFYMSKETTKQFAPARGESVADRPRSDYAPTPIVVGSFNLFPALSAGGYYDSNIYASQNNEENDVVYKVNPSAVLQSNWGRHALSISALGDFSIYNDNSDENNYNGAIQAEGRYDIARQTWIAGNVSQERSTESRGNPSSPTSTDEPTAFDVTKAGVSAYRGAGLVSAKLGYNTSIYNYSDPDLSAGGKLDTAGRDRQQHLVTGEIGYAASANFKPFVRANYDIRDYDSNPFRDSDGYNVVLGADADFGGLLTAELYAGYLAHDYDDMSGGDFSTVDFGGNVTWNLSTLTSLEGEFGRSVEETTVGGIVSPTAASGYLATGGSVTLTHELRRDVIIEGQASYTSNEYGNSAREDDVFGTGGGVRYFLNRNFYVDATYNYSQRDANVAGSDYDKHVVFGRISAQY